MNSLCRYASSEGVARPTSQLVGPQSGHQHIISRAAMKAIVASFSVDRVCATPRRSEQHYVLDILGALNEPISAAVDVFAGSAEVNSTAVD